MNDDIRRVVVVSGGSRGLGQAIVADFRARGSIVATFSRSPTPFIEGLLRNDPEGSTCFWEQIDGTDCGRVKLGPRGIRVNSLAPGYFESDMTHNLTAEQRSSIVRRTPLGRLVTIADVVAAVRFLAGPESALITGQTLVVDGGLTC